MERIGANSVLPARREALTYAVEVIDAEGVEVGIGRQERLKQTPDPRAIRQIVRARRGTARFWRGSRVGHFRSLSQPRRLPGGKNRAW